MYIPAVEGDVVFVLDFVLSVALQVAE